MPTAIRLVNTLYERSRIGWFEEPLPPESYDALRAVREHTAAPIVAGERLGRPGMGYALNEAWLRDHAVVDAV